MADYRKKYRTPDAALARRIERGETELGDIFCETTLSRKDVFVELVVVEAFAKSAVKRIDEFGNPEYINTPGRMIGADGHIESLATFILSQVKMGRITKQLVRRCDLADGYWDLTQVWYEKLARLAVRQLIIRVLLDLRDGDEWHDTNDLYYQFNDDLGQCAWVVPQSVLDRRQRLVAQVQELIQREQLERAGNTPTRSTPFSRKPRTKRDDRHWHGRPGRDRKRKAAPPGSSTAA